MLKGIEPLLNPDLLHMLGSMGHGDELVIADANFPAASLARRLVSLSGVNTSRALQAILTVFPLDQYIEKPASVMAVVTESEAVPETYGDFQAILNAAEGSPVTMAKLERFAFYERAKQAFGIVATNETRLYGNILLSKGVVAPEEKK